MIERPEAVTLEGKPMTVIGKALQPGDTAPDFRVVAQDLSEKTLDDYTGKPLIISVVTSLDTGVCDLQTRRFDEEAAKLADKAAVLTISADLPFAQKRWCSEAATDKVEVLSDHREMSFGDAWGTHVKELRVEQRAVFVVDAEGKIQYADYVPEISEHPNYQAALEAINKIVD